MLYDQLSKIIDRAICDSENTYTNFLKRLQEGAFTRDENSQTHFCAYFPPYNSHTKEVFIVHHKKSGLWLFPGGHVDKGEVLLETLNREIHEELGVKSFFQETPNPFLLTITPIENPVQPCKAHFDVWCLVETDGKDFNVDPTEFHDTQWMTFDEAERIVIDSANRAALERIKHGLDSY